MRSGEEISGLEFNVVSPTQPSVSRPADEPSGRVPEPMSFDLQRKISTGHREFEEKALAVSTLSGTRSTANNVKGSEASQWRH